MPNSVNLRKRLSVVIGNTNFPPVEMFFHCIESWRGHVREYTLKETDYICQSSGFEILMSITFENLAQQKLRFPLRNLYQLFGNLIKSLRSSLLIVCRKPKSWQPVAADTEAYRKAIAPGLPEGIR